MYSLAAIVPFYNEERFLEESVTKLIETNLFDEVILVDDNSNDESSYIAKNIEKKYEIVKYYKKNNNEGKGSAVIFGYSKTSCSHIIVHDADLEYNPNDIVDLKKLSRKNPASLILGSRTIGNIKRSKQYNYLVIGNRFITYIFSKLNKISISDISTCYMLYPKIFIDNAKINEKNLELKLKFCLNL